MPVKKTVCSIVSFKSTSYSQQESCVSAQNTARSEDSVSKWLDVKVYKKFKSSGKVYEEANMKSVVSYTWFIVNNQLSISRGC